MRRAFENSCIKGCAIYLAVLVTILVASAAGLGGLRARFGTSAPSVQSSGDASHASGNVAPQAQTAPPVAVATDGAQAQPQVETPPPGSGPQVIIINPPAQAPTPTFMPTPTPVLPAVPPPVAAPAQSSYAPQVQAQGGEITGQASQPFYIVQPNDTLSQIAARFSTTVDALQKANNLSDIDSIWPGQLLYLSESANAQPGGSIPPPVENSSQGALPSMPDTGINAGH